MKKSILLSAVALVAVGPHEAWAQNVNAAAPPADSGTSSSGVIDEIIVTAQKRSENLQNVPIAVTAITENSLEAAGVRGIQDLTVAVPGLSTSVTYGRLTMNLRGVGSTSVGPGIENPIALYIDGVYYATTSGSLLSLNNVKQIEVLKGPQGTLFGRNATGGLVHVITKEPTQEAAGAFEVTYGNYNTIIGSSYISGGLTDNLAADLAIYAKHQGDGWGKQLATGRDVYDVDHDISVRSKFVFTPGENTKITLIGDYSNVRDTMLPTNIRANSISPFLPGVQPDTGYSTNANVLPEHTIKTGGGSLRWDQEVGGLKLSSITAYRKTRALIVTDIDVIQQDQASLHIETFDKQFSQELQLSSGSHGKLNWTVGAFYFDADGGYLNTFQPLNYAGIVYSLPSTKQKIRSVAAYAQATYPVDERTNVTLGVRYTHETHKLYDAFVEIAPIVPLIGPISQSTTDNAATWRASIDHRFSPEILVYASYNRGFKAGGFNVASPTDPAFRPERLDAFEVGAKTDLFDRRVRFNVAGFYYKYNDIQVTRFKPPGAISTVNGAGAESYGFDAELTAKLFEGLTLTGGVSYAHPTFTKYPNCLRAAPNGGVPTFPGDCSGLELPNASRTTANMALDYSFAVAGGSLNLNGNAYYNSGFYTDLANAIHQSRYAKLGASIRWTDASERFSIQAYGTNLTNKRVLTYGESVSDGTMEVGYAEPRTYGISLGYKY